MAVLEGFNFLEGCMVPVFHWNIFCFALFLFLHSSNIKPHAYLSVNWNILLNTRNYWAIWLIFSKMYLLCNSESLMADVWRKAKFLKDFCSLQKKLFDIHLLLLIVRLHKAFLTSSSMKFPPWRNLSKWLWNRSDVDA